MDGTLIVRYSSKTLHFLLIRVTERDAYGDDEYHPISRRGSNLSDAGGIGYTVVDAIDTMVIMGLHDEEERARDWVANKLDFNRDGKFNTFEVCAIYAKLSFTSETIYPSRQRFVYSVAFSQHTT